LAQACLFFVETVASETSKKLVFYLSVTK